MSSQLLTKCCEWRARPDVSM